MVVVMSIRAQINNEYKYKDDEYILYKLTNLIIFYEKKFRRKERVEKKQFSPRPATFRLWSYSWLEQIVSAVREAKHLSA